MGDWGGGCRQAETPTEVLISQMEQRRDRSTYQVRSIVVSGASLAVEMPMRTADMRVFSG